MTRYNKGANAERELIRLFSEKGFAVARVAGSGVSVLPSPDIIAMKQGKCLAIECKAWDQAYLSLSLQQMAELEQWAKIAGIEMFVAWKLSRRGWFFLKPGQFKKSRKFHVISQKKALKNGLPLEIVSGEQAVFSSKK